MNIETAKQINLADYLHSLGYSPVKQQGTKPGKVAILCHIECKCSDGDQ